MLYHVLGDYRKFVKQSKHVNMGLASRRKKKRKNLQKKDGKCKSMSKIVWTS